MGARVRLFRLAVLFVGRTWAYDVPLNTHKIDFWDINQVVGWPERPAPRAHHSLNFLRGMLFVFGGMGSDGTVLGDLNFYDTVTRSWSGEIAREWCCDEKGNVVDVERGYQPPAARAFHAAVEDEQAGRLFVVGGYNDEVGELGDVQFFDPAQMRWSGPLEISGPTPRSRSGHVAFFKPGHGGGSGDAIYIFGGYSSTGGHLNDLHKLSLTADNFRWSEVSTSNSGNGGGGWSDDSAWGLAGLPPPRPSPRRHATAAVISLPNSLSVILVGGMRGPTITGGSGKGGGNGTDGSTIVFGDTWQLEFVGARVTWKELEMAGGEEGRGLPRFHHACIASGTRLVVTGGRSPNLWSSSALSSVSSLIKTSGEFATGMTAVGHLAERIEGGGLPPHTYTLDVVTGSASSTWTLGGQGSVSPADSCRTPPGLTEIPLTGVSEEVVDTVDASYVAVGRYGHAMAYHGGLVYEYGGFGEMEAGVEADGEVSSGLLLGGGLKVSYLAEGHDGRFCPVWVESK